MPAPRVGMLGLGEDGGHTMMESAGDPQEMEEEEEGSPPLPTILEAMCAACSRGRECEMAGGARGSWGYGAVAVVMNAG